MWQDIFSFNRQKIAMALGEMLDPLVRVRDGLAQEGEAGLLAALEVLEQAQAARNSPSGRPRRPRESS
jgi:prephenate dehydrogenase